MDGGGLTDFRSDTAVRLITARDSQLHEPPSYTEIKSGLPEMERERIDNDELDFWVFDQPFI